MEEIDDVVLLRDVVLQVQEEAMLEGTAQSVFPFTFCFVFCMSLHGKVLERLTCKKSNVDMTRYRNFLIFGDLEFVWVHVNRETPF